VLNWAGFFQRCLCAWAYPCYIWVSEMTLRYILWSQCKYKYFDVWFTYSQPSFDCACFGKVVIQLKHVAKPKQRARVFPKMTCTTMRVQPIKALLCKTTACVTKPCKVKTIKRNRTKPLNSATGAYSRKHIPRWRPWIIIHVNKGKTTIIFSC
jgi:hypothetical protein